MKNKEQKSHALFNIVGEVYTYISMAIIICVIAFILIVTIKYGWGVLTPHFLLTEPNPSALDAASGGILTPIIGTLILTLIGIAISFPFSLATAIYLCFYSQKGLFKTLVKSAVDILSGVPTIVIALFALVIFTLPQMGFLSAVVDTRVNALNGAMLVYRYGSTLIEVGFEENLALTRTAKQSAETIGTAFNQALRTSGVPTGAVSVETLNGKVIIGVAATAASPLEYISCSKESVAAALGLVTGVIINPGDRIEYTADVSQLTDGKVRSYGRSFLVCGITMAIMILPFVIKSMEEALKSVPTSYIDAALALGASKWRTISKVVLRAARDGLITGVILGMGRIVGDTAIVWLTLGGSIRMTGAQPWFSPENWVSTLKNGGGTLTTYIYYTSPAGEGNHFDVAFGASLVLIFMIILLNIFAVFVGKAGVKENG